MIKKREIQTQTPKTLRTNHTLQPILIDGVEIAFREDNLCFLRLITELPEGPIEQGKFFMPKEVLQNFIEAATAGLNETTIKSESEKSKKS